MRLITSALAAILAAAVTGSAAAQTAEGTPAAATAQLTVPRVEFGGGFTGAVPLTTWGRDIEFEAMGNARVGVALSAKWALEGAFDFRGSPEAWGAEGFTSLYRVQARWLFKGPAEALDNHDRSAAPVCYPSLSGHVAKETEHRPDRHPHDGPTEVVIPRHPVPKPVRERQDPLPHGHRREHVVHQVRGAFRHSSPAAAGTHRPASARKRNEPVQPAVITAKARKAPRQASAAQQRAELPPPPRLRRGSP